MFAEAAGVLFIVMEPRLETVVVGVGLLALAAFLAYNILENFQWVELDGDVIRAKRFWARRVVEQRIDEITKVQNFGMKGYIIYFEHGPRIGLMRYDMVDVDGFATALAERLKETRSASGKTACTS